MHIMISTYITKLSVVAHICNPGTWKAEAGKMLQVQGQSRPHHEFKLNCIKKSFPVSKERI